jgi:hypothetical protein
MDLPPGWIRPSARILRGFSFVHELAQTSQQMIEKFSRYIGAQPRPGFAALSRNSACGAREQGCEISPTLTLRELLGS